jgi:hypothetical protein
MVATRNILVMPAKAGIQYSAASRSRSPMTVEYWIARFRGR